MFYIVDNGMSHADRCLYIVEAPEDFGEWFVGVLMPWYQARSMKESLMTIVASAPSFVWHGKNAIVSYEDLLGGGRYLDEYDPEGDRTDHRPTYRGV